MQKIIGSQDLPALQCTNPRREHYKLRFGFSTIDDGTASYYETTFAHFPTKEEAKNIITDTINAETDEKILTGCTWRSLPVYLSSENQFNFKAAYDLAVQTNGATLPITLKLGSFDNGNPAYYTFSTLTDFSEFFMSIMNFVQTCLSECWQQKESINIDKIFSDYEQQQL